MEHDEQTTRSSDSPAAPPSAADTATRPTLVAPPPLPAIPGYRIVRPLGEGGMGKVYVALQVTLQRTVALKVLKPALADDPDFEERFLREARIAASVNHRNVVAIHDAGRGAGHLYMAFEYMPGGDLGARIAGGRPLPEREVLDLVIACAEGLAAIHQAGLIHRDLKPENILLAPDGGPRIADLGLARTTQGGDRLTATGLAMGTPAYMSPEQATGAADIDLRTDCYSLGATCFALLTGKPPFTGATPWVTVHQVISAEPADPRTANPAVSAATAAIVRHAMGKDRAARYQDCGELLADLRAARDGFPLLHAGRAARPATAAATAPARVAQPPLTILSHRLLVVGGAILAAVVGASLVTMLIGDGADLHDLDPPADAASAEISVEEPPAASGAKGTGGGFRQLRSAIRGTLIEVVDHPLPDVHRAILTGLRRRGLAVTSENLDETSAVVESATPEGKAFRVSLSARDPGTEIAVQVGPFGDELRSQRVLAMIRREL